MPDPSNTVSAGPRPSATAWGHDHDHIDHARHAPQHRGAVTTAAATQTTGTTSSAGRAGATPLMSGPALQIDRDAPLASARRPRAEEPATSAPATTPSTNTAPSPTEVQRYVDASRASGTMQLPPEVPMPPALPTRTGADLVRTLDLHAPRVRPEALERAIRERREHSGESESLVGEIVLTGAHAAADATAFGVEVAHEGHALAGAAHATHAAVATSAVPVEAGVVVAPAIELVGLGLLSFELGRTLHTELVNILHNNANPSSAIIETLREHLPELQAQADQRFATQVESRYNAGRDAAASGRPTDPARASDPAYQQGVRDGAAYRQGNGPALDRYAARDRTVNAIHSQLQRTDPATVSDGHPVQSVLTSPPEGASRYPTVGAPPITLRP